MKTKKLIAIFLELILIIQMSGFAVLSRPEEVKAEDDPLCGTTITDTTPGVVDHIFTLDHDVVCSGNGLIIGSNDLILDGGHHTITGNGSGNGIRYSPDDVSTVVIENFNIVGFSWGISWEYSIGGEISNNTVRGNLMGIYLGSSSEVSVTGNSIISNSEGIKLDDTSSSTLTENIMQDNVFSFFANDANNIDTSNTVEGKPIVFLYDIHGNSGNNKVYSGDLSDIGKGYDYVGEIGVFWCISCSYVTIKNATLSSHNYAGIYFKNTIDSTIDNVKVNDSRSNGIDLVYSGSSGHPNYIKNSEIENNYTGVFLSNSSYNILSNNTVKANKYGISSSFATLNEITNNTLTKNENDIWDKQTNNNYSGNHIKDSMINKMLSFNEISRTRNINETIPFNFSMFDIKGNPCSAPTCSYEGTSISPNETLNITSVSNNNYAGSFSPSRKGTYSLIFTVRDSNNNTTTRRYLFFIGNTESKQIRYYMRGISPTHAQGWGNGHDAMTLLPSPPDNDEDWWCSDWVQNNIDEIPDFPLSYLTEINASQQYTSGDIGLRYVGPQRFLSDYYDAGNTVDISQSLNPTNEYVWTNNNFSNVNWGMDYPNSWYWLTLKLKGFGPTVRTVVGQPSYADFTYKYTSTPAIKSISNNDISVLSATTSQSDVNDVSVVVEGVGSTDLTFDKQKRPFLNYSTTITPSDETVHLTDLSGKTTIGNLVDMDIEPNAGSVNISIAAWNDNTKRWVESGTGVTSTLHTIGGLKANANYSIKTNGDWSKALKTDSYGTVVFNYDGGYSTHEFELVEDSAAPNIALDSSSNISSTSETSVALSGEVSDLGSGLSTLTINGIPVSFPSGHFSATVSLSLGLNTISIVATDSAGNSTTNTILITRTSLQEASSGGSSLGDINSIIVPATKANKVLAKDNVSVVDNNSITISSSLNNSQDVSSSNTPKSPNTISDSEKNMKIKTVEIGFISL